MIVFKESSMNFWVAKTLVLLNAEPLDDPRGLEFDSPVLLSSLSMDSMAAVMVSFKNGFKNCFRSCRIDSRIERGV